MKITRKQLRGIIRTERARLAEVLGGTGEAQVGDIEPDELEDLIAAGISETYQEYILSQKFEGTYDTWNTEVQNAAQRLYEELIQSGALTDVSQTIETIDQALHDGGLRRDVDRHGHEVR